MKKSSNTSQLHKSYSDFTNNATPEEKEALLKQVFEEANQKQRETATPTTAELREIDQILELMKNRILGRMWFGTPDEKTKEEDSPIHAEANAKKAILALLHQQSVLARIDELQWFIDVLWHTDTKPDEIFPMLRQRLEALNQSKGRHE